MNYYNEIKRELIENEINKKVKEYSKNKYELQKYYNVGRIIFEAGKHYGDGVLRDYSVRLTKELNKKYDISSLNRMKKFYILVEKMATLSPNLSYSHYIELLPYNDVNKIKYYIKEVEINNYSVRQLREKIKSYEYERLPEKTKNKLINKDKLNIKDIVPNPILIKNKNKDVISEKILQSIILEDIPSFLKELGGGFTFIDNEYKIKLGERYNYIDLLLYNINYNCYVVVELKIGELKKEYIGQIEVYMNYIDKNIKRVNQDKTIGIIMCKKNNELIIEYASDNRIYQREYKLV